MTQSLTASSALSLTFGLRMRRIRLRLRDSGFSAVVVGSLAMTDNEFAVVADPPDRLALMRAAFALACRFSSGSSTDRTVTGTRPSSGDPLSVTRASFDDPFFVTRRRSEDRFSVRWLIYGDPLSVTSTRLVDAETAVQRRAWSNSLRKIVLTLSSFLAETSTTDDCMPFASAHSSVFSIAIRRLDTRSHCSTRHNHINTSTLKPQPACQECHPQQMYTKPFTKIFLQTSEDLDSPSWLYHSTRSATTWHWVSQCCWTCCWSFAVNGVDSWRYAPPSCMLQW